MATMFQDISIEAKPEQVWAAVRDGGAVHRRLVRQAALILIWGPDARTLSNWAGLACRRDEPVDRGQSRPDSCPGGCHAVCVADL